MDERVVGVGITDAPGRGRLIPTAPAVGGAGVVVNGGFKCVAAKDGADNVIRVYLGLLTNCADPLPAGMSLGDVPPYTIAPDGDDGYVVLGVTVSDVGDEHDGEPLSCFIDVNETTVPPNTDTVFYLPIGTYATDGASFVVTPGGAGNGVGDQQFQLCGGLGGTPEFWPA